MKQCVVVIPVYSETPSEQEIESFKNTLSVLRKQDIFVVTYRECCTKIYDDISNQVGIKIRYEFFPSRYFTSVHDYNDLCFSDSFYKRFDEYLYMLICQLDVWIFRDEVSYWCEKGYDYIGAPIFYGYTANNFSTKIMGIGNGGFSLRKISHAKAIVSAPRNKVFLKPTKIISLYINTALINKSFRKRKFRMLALPLIIIAKCIGFNNTLKYYIDNHLNEDLIFGSWSAAAWGMKVNLPEIKEAIKFAFEVHPEILYKEANNHLPFGCHAYLKWDYSSFWSKYIRK